MNESLIELINLLRLLLITMLLICRIVRGGSWANIELALDYSIYITSFEKIPVLGRFIMRDEGKTVGIGRILEVKQKKSKE